MPTIMGEMNEMGLEVVRLREHLKELHKDPVKNAEEIKKTEKKISDLRSEAIDRLYKTSRPSQVEEDGAQPSW